MAPAMVYKTNTLVCGHSVEINVISDIQLDLSINQIKLISVLTNELFTIFEPPLSGDLLIKRPKILFPYSKAELSSTTESAVGFESSDFATRDSGIEIPSASLKSKVSGTSSEGA